MTNFFFFFLVSDTILTKSLPPVSSGTLCLSATLSPRAQESWVCSLCCSHHGSYMLFCVQIGMKIVETGLNPFILPTHMSFTVADIKKILSIHHPSKVPPHFVFCPKRRIRLSDKLKIHWYYGNHCQPTEPTLEISRIPSQDFSSKPPVVSHHS